MRSASSKYRFQCVNDVRRARSRGVSSGCTNADTDSGHGDDPSSSPERVRPRGLTSGQPVAGRQGWDRAPTRPASCPTAPVSYPTAPVSYPTAPVPYPTAPVPHPTAPVPYPTAPVPHPTAPVPHPTAPVPYPTAPASHRPPGRRYGFRRHRSGVGLALARHGRASGRTSARYRLGAARPRVARAAARRCDTSAAAIDRRSPARSSHDGFCRPPARRAEVIELRCVVRSPRRLACAPRSRSPPADHRAIGDRTRPHRGVSRAHRPAGHLLTIGRKATQSGAAPSRAPPIHLRPLSVQRRGARHPSQRTDD